MTFVPKISKLHRHHKNVTVTDLGFLEDAAVCIWLENLQFAAEARFTSWHYVHSFLSPHKLVWVSTILITWKASSWGLAGSSLGLTSTNFKYLLKHSLSPTFADAKDVLKQLMWWNVETVDLSAIQETQIQRSHPYPAGSSLTGCNPQFFKTFKPTQIWTNKTAIFFFQLKNAQCACPIRPNTCSSISAHAQLAKHVSALVRMRSVINKSIGCRYSSFQVGCPKIATRIRACAKFSIQNPHQKGAHARILVAIFGQPTWKLLYTLARALACETMNFLILALACHILDLKHLLEILFLHQVYQVN